MTAHRLSVPPGRAGRLWLVRRLEVARRGADLLDRKLSGYRLRAVRDRWTPRLEQALAETTLAIEELERADAARLRRAVGMIAVPPAEPGI
jgi:V/A-type H+/Na+-transporting ATPase subunit D